MSMVISVLHSSSVSVLSLMKSPSGIAVSGPVNWDQKMNPSKILAQLGQFPLTLSHPLITPQLQLETHGETVIIRTRRLCHLVERQVQLQFQAMSDDVARYT